MIVNIIMLFLSGRRSQIQYLQVRINQPKTYSNRKFITVVAPISCAIIREIVLSRSVLIFVCLSLNCCSIFVEVIKACFSSLFMRYVWREKYVNVLLLRKVSISRWHLEITLDYGSLGAITVDLALHAFSNFVDR